MTVYSSLIQPIPVCRWLSGIALLLTGNISLSAQSLRTLSAKDGLPQSFVSGLVQDDSSFIWIGTRGGLARYDGNQFKVFQHNPHDSTTLASNLIIWMEKGRHNALWIEHESGEIDGVDPVTEKITHLLQGNLPSQPGIQFIRRGWIVDDEKIFWGIKRGDGINSYDSRNKKIDIIDKKHGGLPGDTVRAITQAKDNAIWMLTQQAISRYDKKTKQLINWSIPYMQDYGAFPGSDAIAVDLYERGNSELMWGDRSSLFFFNPLTHAFRSVALPNTAYMGARWIRSSPDGQDYFENYGKVYRYSDKTGLTSIGKTLKENLGDVKSFLVDHSGLIWLGTNAGGLHQIDLATPFFQAFTYRKDFGIDMFQQELGIDIFKMFGWTPKDSLFSAAGYHIRSAYNGNKRLYLALKEYVCYYDSTQKKFVRLPHVPVSDGSEPGIGIKGITFLPDGRLLVVGYKGNILVFNTATQTWENFLGPDLFRKRFGAAALPQDVLADDKNIWITTANNGLVKIIIQSKEIHQLKERAEPGSLPANQLLGFRADPLRPDIVWIGSYQGLISLNKKTLKCEVYSVKDGLPDNTVYAILSDRNNNLWLSTNKGICRFDPVTHETRVFHTLHGLPGDEFNRFHQLALPDDRLIFGGTDGWTVFNPLLMKNDAFEPAVAFTDIKINNKDIAQADVKKILPLPLNALDRLVLLYEQNTLNIGFAGLEFSQPQDLQYRYKLQGYDNDWIIAGNNHQANYTKIPPGSYTFLVNASNTSGKWSSHIKEIKLKINPPWWATKMAFVCYTIILAGLTWIFIRFRVSRMLMKQEMILKEKEALQLKEIDDMKTRFFANITHEFRTPLTLIMGPAEQLKAAQSNNPQQKKYTETILANAKQLLVLINRLMDLSKLEAKAMKLQEQRGNPASVAGTIVYSFEADAGAKDIELSFTDKTVLSDCWFYADAVERIVYNLVSNALKFTPAGGKVEILLAEKNNSLQLAVTDTGIGIPADRLPHIFDRFYQVGENNKLSKEEWNNGTGIGLSLVKELIQQMDGDIDVKSSTSADESASGTTFTVLMPFRISEEEQISSSLLVDEEGLLEKNPETDDKRPQVLIVEDNTSLAGFIAAVLKDDYEITHALNGALGLEEAVTVMPDIIISDVMMPVMDGYEFCSRVKSDIRTSHIPVIMLTAKATHDNMIEGLTKGADDYLAKPFYPTELLLRMRNQLERQQKLRERIQQELAFPGNNPAPAPVIQDIFITKLYELLDEHIDDSLFGVEQVADLMNISRSSLHRKLKNITGMTTTEVVRNYRLKKATFFLKEGFSSSETAYKTGFSSPAYFTKSFREVYGVTPGDFVRQPK